MKNIKRLAVLLLGLSLVLSLVIAQESAVGTAGQQPLRLQRQVHQGEFGVQGRFMQHHGQQLRGQGQFRQGGPGTWQGQPHGLLMGLLGPGLTSSLGTTITVTFYDGDPEASANELSRHSLTLGQDSESAFMNALAEARVDAVFARIDLGEQNRSYPLDDGQTFQFRRLSSAMLNDGSTITVNLYSEDPATGSSPIQTLSYVHGQDSAIAFQQELSAAISEAAFITVNTSPQSRLLDLSDAAMPQRGMGFGRFR